jgi:glutaconate CoA-transferase subunit B
MSDNVTPVERMVISIAREICDGDVLLEGIGTFLPTSAYLLAQATHAPNALRLCPVGNTFVRTSHRLTCSDYEFSTIELGLYNFDYHEVNAAYLPSFLPGRRGSWKEFLRPAQVDSTGRTNNVVIGDLAKPRVRLPGAAGLPDGIPLEPQVFMYVPRHNRQTFVERVDFISAPGTQEGAHPYKIVTDLGILGFDESGRMRVDALFPGVTADMIARQTEFRLTSREPLVEPPEPSSEELNILRTRVDPLGLRNAEYYSGAERLAFLEKIARQEDGFERVRNTIRDLLDRSRAT